MQFKSFVPFSFGKLGVELPSWLDESFTGQIPWACLFTVIISIVSLPRKLSSVRFGSAISVMISFYVVLFIIFEALLNNGTSSSLKEGFQQGHEKMQLSMKGVF